MTARAALDALRRAHAADNDRSAVVRGVLADMRLVLSLLPADVALADVSEALRSLREDARASSQPSYAERADVRRVHESTAAMIDEATWAWSRGMRALAALNVEVRDAE